MYIKSASEKIKIHVMGSGAREEAIKFAISKSSIPHNIVNNPDDADLIIFGPEQPICDGLVDAYTSKGIKCIGVNKKFSKLESSKLFAKEFMNKYGIKNANVLPNDTAILPRVYKKDGLCGGKGVKVLYKNEKIPEFDFVEEYLEGEEISVMSLFDGKTLLNFLPSRDFKRLSADKNSPNTGGMGSYCPVDLTCDQKGKLDSYLEQLENALISEGADFAGFIYSGLVWAKDDWFVLEYNVRLGDPEAQSILTHLENDFLEILLSALEQKLNTIKLSYKENYSACLTLTAEGYPDEPIKGDEITLPESDEVRVFYAGVEKKDGKLYSNGGRVLSLCTTSDNPFPVLKDYADSVKMEHKYYRKDIAISELK